MSDLTTVLIVLLVYILFGLVFLVVWANRKPAIDELDLEREREKNRRARLAEKREEAELLALNQQLLIYQQQNAQLVKQISQNVPLALPQSSLPVLPSQKSPSSAPSTQTAHQAVSGGGVLEAADYYLEDSQ
jgi:FtsZ-interacting cell division protein ZipA